ncbi:MAG: FlgD immunoglobulin-like domain containing protein [bacterium]|jgi:hypothetical protein
MRVAIAVIFVLLIVVSTSAFADFDYVGKIAAPRPYYGCPVLGMTHDAYNLFVTVDTDTSQWFYLVDAPTGDVLGEHEWLDHGPIWPQFEGASCEGGYVYWVADYTTGMLIRFEWIDGEVAVLDTVLDDRIIAPAGMVFHEGGEAVDVNLVTDVEYDSVFVVDVLGNFWGSEDLSGIPFIPPMNATSISEYGGHYFITSAYAPDTVYEASADMERLAAHHLPMPYGWTPEAATFFNGLYYVGSASDSIYIFSLENYSGDVPQGSNVRVDIVPEGLSITFDFVATAGSLFVDQITDTCPSPGGVAFFGDFYDVSTTAEFDYIAAVEMQTNDPLPPWVAPRRVRVFKRPSGPCSFWRDITVRAFEAEDPPQTLDAFRVLTRTLSEDDEFSVFCLGEDNRSPAFVIGLKYGFLREAIVGNQDSIPGETYTILRSLFEDSEAAYAARRIGMAARLANRIADVTRNTPAIPHRYEPGNERINVAGRIIARAHTLAFSLGQLINQNAFGIGGGKATEPTETLIERAPVNTLISGPNPSASGFTVKLSGTSIKPVSVRVYSVKGELVSTVLESGSVSGERTLTWDGRNDAGQAVSTGTYFIVVSEGETNITRKVVLTR